jgi:hypothetical protein
MLRVALLSPFRVGRNDRVVASGRIRTTTTSIQGTWSASFSSNTVYRIQRGMDAIIDRTGVATVEDQNAH